ncbi:MAG: glycoside hydrolase family 127 protein [Clostridia bacterium]|nr:glycoside hydrolase family 127 protein [Clostridia bacterium]
MKTCTNRLAGWPTARAELLLQRLHQREYDPDVLVVEDSGWAGDYEGRAFLALVLLSAIRGEKVPNYEAVLDTLWVHRNEKGYMGPVLTDGFNEQQLSGNSWLLRGVCEAYACFREPRAKQMVLDIVEHLLLPATGFYGLYPADKAQRAGDNVVQEGLAGKTDTFAFSDDTDGEDAMQLITRLTGKVGPWYISTDVGCAFIMMDGVTAAYECMKRYMPEQGDLIRRTGVLIREMCGVFLRLEFIRMAVQTHATLSGLRGVLRFARLEQDEALLAEVRRVFDLYLREGMTENYENYNWFTRPVHTEPCGTIDSFILAYWLWEDTGEATYIQLANRILYNGILPTQRQNGGFGLHTCVGADTWEVKPPQKGICEAHWCCTMRGGEFFEKLWDFAARQEGDTLWLPIPVSGTVRGEGFTAVVSTTYPEENRLTVRLQNNVKIRRVLVYLPATAVDIQLIAADGSSLSRRREATGFAEIPVTGDGEWRLSFTLPDTPEATVNIHSLPGRRRLRGDLLLGRRSGADWEPFYDAYWRYGEAAASMAWNVIEEANDG